MENQDMLWSTFPAYAGSWLFRTCTKEVLLQLHRCIDVDRSGDMATIIFIIKSAVNNLVRCNLRPEGSIQYIIELRVQH